MTVCGSTTVNGMDVSHYDGAIDWPTAHASGIDFAFVKATESTDFVDPTFATNWAGMKAAGVVRGAYHFFHADVDPVAQANYVMMTVGPLEPGDLPIVLDLETTNGQSESTVLANATTFLATVSKGTGRNAIVYVSPSFLSDYSTLSPYLLWIANWGVSCPDVPAPWSTYTFWQSSSTGTVSGVSGGSAVDLDSFNGTLEQLKSFGVDAGTAADSGTTADAGGGGPDASAGGDSGSGGRGPHDSGTPPHTGGSGDAGAEAGVWDGTGNPGGCAVTASAPARDAGPCGAAILLGVLAAVLRRRRRA